MRLMVVVRETVVECAVTSIKEVVPGAVGALAVFPPHEERATASVINANPLVASLRNGV